MFYATLSPYQGTEVVYGRDVYVFNEKNENTEDPIELDNPVCKQAGEVFLKVKEKIKNPKIFVYFPEKDDFKHSEIKCGRELQKGETVKAIGQSPFSFITIGKVGRTDNHII